MRCKNCGCENDDNVYICQNCGSPLYDEDEIPGGDDSDSTRMFTPAGESQKNNNPENYENYLDNFNNKTKADLPDYSASDPYQHRQRQSTGDKSKEEKDKKKQIAIIIILIIVLIAIVTGIIVAAANGKKKNNTTTAAPAVVTSETSEEDTSDDYTTRHRTTEEETSERTTESTTEEETSESTTAKSTTQAKSYEVTVGTNDFGGADGGGTFKKGESATVTCWPDDSSQEFLGWYKNGVKVSESRSYTFTVDGDSYLEAHFKEKQTHAAKTPSGSAEKSDDDGNE